MQYNSTVIVRVQAFAVYATQKLSPKDILRDKNHLYRITLVHLTWNTVLMIRKHFQAHTSSAAVIENFAKGEWQPFHLQVFTLNLRDQSLADETFHVFLLSQYTLILQSQLYLYLLSLYFSRGTNKMYWTRDMMALQHDYFSIYTNFALLAMMKSGFSHRAIL